MEDHARMILRLFNDAWGAANGTPDEAAVHGAIVAAKEALELADRIV